MLDIIQTMWKFKNYSTTQINYVGNQFWQKMAIWTNYMTKNFDFRNFESL